MVGETRGVFTKRVLGEKHISSILCDYPGRVATTSLCYHPRIVSNAKSNITTELQRIQKTLIKD